MKQELTHKFCTGARHKAGGPNEYRDTGIKGLNFRVGKNTKTWLLRYKNKHGVGKAYKLGAFPTLSLAKARDQASTLKERIRDEGFDPAAERDKAKEWEGLGADSDDVPTDQNPETVAQAVAQYMKLYVRVGANIKRPEHKESIFRNHILPAWGDRKIVDLRRADGFELVDHIEAKSGHVMANRTIELARALINWLMDRHRTELQGNPFAKISANQKEKPRDRILEDVEIDAIWKDSGSKQTLFADIVKIMFLTGQREGEVAGMCWSEIDFKNRMWNLPGERTKNALPHQVYLADPVLEILKRRKEFPTVDSELIFTTTGSTPFSAWSQSKRRLDKRAGVNDWRLHDIRRTVVTGMSELGIMPQVVEAAINHISGEAKAGVAGVYNRAQYKDQRQEALTRWAQHLMGLVEGKPDNVEVLADHRA